MIGIVDYGSGNIKAIANVYRRLQVPFTIVSTAAEIERASRVILPGVGAFDHAMHQLNQSGLRAALEYKVTEERAPLLGICVGMQLLACRSDEGELEGLGWIDGEVRRFEESQFTHRTHLPHMGWNEVAAAREHPLFYGLDLRPSFYFLHSYYFSCDRPGDVLAATEYGGRFACAVNSENICGVQFHPEKSHQSGMQLLKNFASM